MKFSIKDFFNHVTKSLKEDFIFCAVANLFLWTCFYKKLCQGHSYHYLKYNQKEKKLS